MSGWADESTVGHWQARAREAALWIPQNSIVLDLGCGDMVLEKELPSGCIYIPSDVVVRDARTIVCNLNKQHLPELKVTHVAVLGVLEHLIHLQHFVKELEKLACPVVISYHFDHWEKEWSHKQLTRPEFDKLFARYEITQSQKIVYPGAKTKGQDLMLLKPRLS
jgi:hypothetical protein